MTIIELNPALQINDMRLPPVEWFTSRLSYQLDKLPEGKQYQLIAHSLDANGIVSYQNNFLYLLASCYSTHNKIAIAPHDIWFLIMGEIATIVHENVESLRHLFTDSPTKKQLIVQTDNVSTMSMGLLLAELRQAIPMDVSVFLPEFSTTTPDAYIAMIASLAHAVKVYYDYSTMCCGLPAIKVLGTAEDWETMLDHLNALDSPNLLNVNDEANQWFERVRQAIGVFRDVAGGGAYDVEYWKSIFRSRNVGSGSQMVINGWITGLYMRVCDLPKIDNFPLSLATVPYKNLDTGREFTAVYGATQAFKDKDGFIYAGYAPLIFAHVSAPSLAFNVERTYVSNRS